eukprot:6378652-Pyramimonas_sp.AAC.1
MGVLGLHYGCAMDIGAIVVVWVRKGCDTGVRWILGLGRGVEMLGQGSLQLGGLWGPSSDGGFKSDRGEKHTNHSIYIYSNNICYIIRSRAPLLMRARGPQ